MIKPRRLLAVSIGLVVVCGGSQLTATETIFAGVPVYSVMSTVDTTLVLTASFAPAFAPLKVPCPAAAGFHGCTIRVTVSTDLSISGGTASFN